MKKKLNGVKINHEKRNKNKKQDRQKPLAFFQVQSSFDALHEWFSNFKKTRTRPVLNSSACSADRLD